MYLVLLNKRLRSKKDMVSSIFTKRQSNRSVLCAVRRPKILTIVALIHVFLKLKAIPKNLGIKLLKEDLLMENS